MIRNAAKNQIIGFTTVEVAVTLAILSLVMGAIYGTYYLSQKTYQKQEVMTEMTQNGRVILERLVREIRQASELATELPTEEALATSTLVFEDGHIAEPYHYIHYFKSDNLIKREILGFYFSGDAEQTLVPWDAAPPQGQTVQIKTLQEAQTIGEYVSLLKFWGSQVIEIALDLSKGDSSLQLRTDVFGRNI